MTTIYLTEEDYAIIESGDADTIKLRMNELRALQANGFASPEAKSISIMFTDLINQITILRSPFRTERDRKLLILITELEKVQAYAGSFLV